LSLLAIEANGTNSTQKKSKNGSASDIDVGIFISLSESFVWGRITSQQQQQQQRKGKELQ